MQRSGDEKNLEPETEELEREVPQEVPQPEKSDSEETRGKIQEVALKYAGPLRGWSGKGPGVA